MFTFFVVLINSGVYWERHLSPHVQIACLSEFFSLIRNDFLSAYFRVVTPMHCNVSGAVRQKMDLRYRAIPLPRIFTIFIGICNLGEMAVVTEACFAV